MTFLRMSVNRTIVELKQSCSIDRSRETANVLIEL